jgi:RND family efflux transporter MFP subunit
MTMTNRIAILSFALMLAGCVSHKRIEQPPQAVQAHRIEAVAPANAGGVRFSAHVSPDSEVALAFRVPGYVVAMKQVRGQSGRMRDLAEGDRVSRGDLLVRIRKAEYREKVQQSASQVEAAKAAALKAQLDYGRASRLYASQSLTKPDFDSAQAQYNSTQAELRAAQAQTSEAEISLNDTSLIAPFGGYIVKKSVERGSFVGSGTAAFSIANTDQVKIVVGVPDTVVRSVKLGQPVQVFVDAFPHRIFNGRITRMATAADPTTRNFEVEIKIPNRRHLLAVGMIASLRLKDEGETKQQASFLIPLSAIVQSSDAGGYGVFLLAKSNTGDIARLRPVQIGAVEGSEIRVSDGLAAGDTVITTGATLLKDGQRVEVLR